MTTLIYLELYLCATTFVVGSNIVLFIIRKVLSLSFAYMPQIMYCLLAVQNSSLGDLVTQSLTHSLTHSVTHGTLLIDIQRATQETCDL